MGNRSYIFAITTILCVSIAYSFDACKVIFDTPKDFSKTDLYIRHRDDKHNIEEHSLRAGKTAAHVYLETLKKKLYFFVAFPAGNSGVGVWFDSLPGVSKITASKPVAIHEDANLKEGLFGVEGLNGVEFNLSSGTKWLSLNDHVLGSMRFIRDREVNRKFPDEVHNNKVEFTEKKLRIYRSSLNELASYVLEIEPQENTEIIRRGGSYEFSSSTQVKLKVRALTGEKPITPMAISEIFLDWALKKMDPDQLEAFAFLFYREKLMAGAPRYFSKFGRDSIYTLNVMMPFMKPEAIESLLNATMSSMHPEKGLISHEQSEGDYVSWENMVNGRPYKGISKPSEDYKMVDGEPAYVVAFANYVKLHPKRANEFLNGKDARGISRRKLMTNLFKHISNSTKAFAENPIYKNLVGFHDGEKTGNWKDSDNGVGGGKYPFDVNAGLIPGALKAMSELHQFFTPTELAEFKRRFEIWNTKVIPLFEIREGEIVYTGVSIDEKGKPVPVMHSDDSFVLAFGHPSDAYLRRIAKHLEYIGTPVGIPVSDARFGDLAFKEMFDNTKYHGYVSWTMVENMIVFGLNRQLARKDLSDETRALLEKSLEMVKHIVEEKAKRGGGEVFSIIMVDGKPDIKPLAGDAKSNSNQLWSHWNLIFSLLTFK